MGIQFQVSRSAAGLESAQRLLSLGPVLSSTGNGWNVEARRLVEQGAHKLSVLGGPGIC